MRSAHPTSSFISSSSSPYPHPPQRFRPKKTFVSFHPVKQRGASNLGFTRTVRRRFIAMADREIDGSTAVLEDSKFGFTRPEMYKTNLAGTIGEHDRHVFLCFNNPETWLPRVEESQIDPLPKLLSSAVKSRKADFTVKTNVTICEGGDGTEYDNGDVLIFPDMIKYKGLKDSNVDGFVDDVLVNGKPWASGVQEVLTGSHIFVCAHGSRDKRCGVCGPILIEKLNEGIESRGLKDQIIVKACTHIGGHKYAGNLIVYSPDSEGKIMGHWYGYVTPDDVPEILDQHVSKGIVIKRLWRGQMGLSVQEMTEQKLPNGNEIKESKKHEESKTEVVVKENGSCCQGVNGFSCCRDGGVSEEKKLNESKNGQGKLSSLIASLDQSNVYAAVGVVGAVATIAVAYSIYKRSG
ncbi:Sucrase/ferredoxin-like family protein [Euphorbia peplus]|nr:Sucrase/ferredoxin-like family protein [Euphorbia peplus]